MSDLWYYAHDDNKIGPCSAQQLMELAASGRILPTDTVWKGGVERGVPARKVRHLFPPAPAGVAVAGAGVPPGERPAPDAEPSPAGLGPRTGPEDSTPAAAGGDPAHAVLAGDNGRKPDGKAPATPNQPGAQPQQARKLRAVGLHGAVIVSQDGTTVKFRKKCTVCGHEDRSWNTLPIQNGLKQVNFFCTKCRKTRRVEIRGLMN